MKDEVADMHLSQENEDQKRRIKFFPKKYYNSVFSMIFENTVIIFTSKKELNSLKITSPEISKSKKARFDMLWDLLPEKTQ